MSSTKGVGSGGASPIVHQQTGEASPGVNTVLSSNVSQGSQSNASRPTQVPTPLRTSLASHQFELRDIPKPGGQPGETVPAFVRTGVDLDAFSKAESDPRDTIVLPNEVRDTYEAAISADKPAARHYWTPQDPGLKTDYRITTTQKSSTTEPLPPETKGGPSRVVTSVAEDISITRANAGASTGGEIVRHDVSDLDRLKQASDEMRTFGVTYKAHVLANSGQTAPGRYPSRTEFDKEAQHLLIGRDASGKTMPRREELARGWALFNNAREAALSGATRSDKTIVFGRTQDVNHSAAAILGFTSEFNSGAVLMPERWNYFMNTCWVMGGIKGGADFVSGTRFEEVPRDVSNTRVNLRENAKTTKPNQPLDLPNKIGQKDESDFRSDVTEKIATLPNLLHYTTTVSVAEIAILRKAGYEPALDDRFGVVLKPPTDNSKAETITFMDAQMEIQEARFGMAGENVSGDRRHVATYLDAIGQGPPNSPEHQQAIGKVVAFVKSITEGVGEVDVDNPDNYLRRKVDGKIGQAMTRAGSDPRRVDTARVEIASSLVLLADNVIDQWNKDASNRPLTSLEAETVRAALIGQQLASRTDLSNLDKTTTNALRPHVLALIGKVTNASPEVAGAADLARTLGDETFRARCRQYVVDNGNDPKAPYGTQSSGIPFDNNEGDSLLLAFTRQLELGNLPAIDASLSGFEKFAKNYQYQYGTA